MKLLRYGPPGAEKPGLLDARGRLRDLSTEIADFMPDILTLELRERLAGVNVDRLPLVGGEPRFGPPIARTGHFIAIGLNYADHAKESGLEIPREPVIFSKAPSCLSGPNDPIVLPKNSRKVDWEVELGFVIGRRAYRVSEAEALDCVFGYCLANDVSERFWQTESTGQWIKGKSAPSFGPLGPWLVTPDEIPDPQNLDMQLDVNGERMQTGNTRTMIFPVAEIIAYTSERMVLEPGDVIITGTPPGVGMGRKPPVYLRAGDVVELAVAGLGRQRQPVVAAGD